MNKKIIYKGSVKINMSFLPLEKLEKQKKNYHFNDGKGFQCELEEEEFKKVSYFLFFDSKCLTEEDEIIYIFIFDCPQGLEVSYF